MLAGAVSLTRLHLDCKIGWGGPKKVALTTATQLYRDGFHWLEAVGTAKGKADAAIDILKIDEKLLTPTWMSYGGDSALSFDKQQDVFQTELRRLLNWK